MLRTDKNYEFKWEKDQVKDNYSQKLLLAMNYLC